MLLSDNRVRERLRRYVCAWESVRDVPRVTIDLGGRTITRTLKGNTVMYVCLSDGTVVDALPGIYTPADFLAELDRIEGLLARLDRTPPEGRARAIREWHAAQAPTRISQAPLEVIVAKGAVESPVLKALEAGPGPEVAPVGPSRFQEYTARLVDASARPESVEQVRRKLAGRDPVALDSSYSRTRLRPGVHLLLSELEGVRPDDCRQPLFQGLLKIPLDDPFLGLGSLVEGTP